MQNKPNFKNSSIYTSTCNTSGYDNFRLICRPKNEPKRTQNEPKRTQNEPKRTQNEPNFSPKLASFFQIKANFKPKQTQFQTFCRGFRTEKIMFNNRLNGKYQQNKLRDVLEKLYKKYNRRQFIPPDPLQFVYRYKSKADREIAALLSASLAYGRVQQIEKDLNLLFSIIGKSPYEFTTHFNSTKRKILTKFKHRFNTGDDICDLLLVLKIVLKKSGSIEKFFAEGYSPNDENDIPALTSFCGRLYKIYREHFSRPVNSGFRYLLANPANGSVCKRLNMFLRWMVRSDDVDLGLWKSLDKSKLLVPVDTHMARLCKILGLYKRKTLSLKAAVEITESFKKFTPRDPVKYDFALSRIGIIENCTGRLRPECKDCELLIFCKL